MLNGKAVLVTGGTGSFGSKCVETILKRYTPSRLVVFSRDELKQSEMAARLSEREYPALRYFIGDVRDEKRLYRAFQDVDYIIHAAALKQVPALEYNPFEAVKTNILGAANIIDAAIDKGVKAVIALSTDKAVSPANLYGATKLCMEKLFIAANSYSGKNRTTFSVVRYGNVLGSRGSVVPLFLKRKASGRLPITDMRMTRFWVSLEQSVDFVLQSLERMTGAEVFVPKLPTMNITDLAKAICPDCVLDEVGIRPGEKLHEMLIPGDETGLVLEYPDRYVIHSRTHVPETPTNGQEGRPMPQGFEYGSCDSTWKISIEELRSLIGQP